MGIFIPLFAFGGCQTTEQKTEKQTQLEQDLIELYTEVRQIVTKAKTRAGGEFVPLTASQSKAIFTNVVEVSERNNVPDIVAKSGYYQNEDIPVLEEFDPYTILQWVENNGTSEMYDMMLKMSEGTLTAETVFSNTELLPNERIALIVSIGALEGLTNPTTNMAGDKIDNCLAIYRIDFHACDVIYGFARIVETCAVIATRGLGWIAEQILDWSVSNAYRDCINTADENFIKCIQ